MAALPRSARLGDDRRPADLVATWGGHRWGGLNAATLRRPRGAEASGAFATLIADEAKSKEAAPEARLRLT